MTHAEIRAKVAIHPEINAALVMTAYPTASGVDASGWSEIAKELATAIRRIKDGDMLDAEAMLFSQATALQTLFVDLSMKAAKQTLLPHYQTFLTLALKAQSQSRSTIQALTELKFPRQVIMKQTNVANGAQQINNGSDVQEPSAARTPENEPLKNKLSSQIEDTRHERETLEFGTTAAASGIDQELVPVEKIIRAKDRIR